jgi:hypothetical protein
LMALIVRMSPQPRRLMADGVHLKRVKADDFAHKLIYFPLFSNAC